MTTDYKEIDYLDDMLRYCDDVIEFIGNTDYNTFSNDKKTLYAVIRSIEIIGEAARKISNDSRNVYNDIPWEDVTGMRDKLIHDYMGVDTEIVWRTATEDIPFLKSKLEEIIET